jgi:hypothetical protein
MVDMGIYFEPPRRRAIKTWAIMRLLAENGLRFQTEGGKAFIEAYILATKRPRMNDVLDNIQRYRKGQNYLNDARRS